MEGVGGTSAMVLTAREKSRGSTKLSRTQQATA